MFAFSGVASAGYLIDRDVKIDLFPSFPTDSNLISNLGDAAFDLQEDLHASFTKATGIEIDHSYIWIGFGGQYIPIDPIYIYGD
jgi:hypothetical protein